MKYKVLICLFLIAFFACCQSSHPKKCAQEKPKILVSLPPHKKLVEKIVLDEFTVETVVPIGSNPHVFEPTPRQVSSISGSKIWFQIGESFEKKIYPILVHQNPDLITKDLRNQVPLLHGTGCKCHHHEGDPLEDKHIWTSPKLLQIQVKNIVDTLTQAFPEKKDFFAANEAIVIQELKELDTKISKQLENVSHRSLLVAHPAFAYFCHDYNLEQISLEFEGKEATISHLQKVIENVKTKQTKYACSMPQHSSKGLEIVANDLHLQIFQIDPYDEDYEKTLTQLAEVMQQ